MAEMGNAQDSPLEEMSRDQTPASSVQINPNEQEDISVPKSEDPPNTTILPSALVQASGPTHWPPFPGYPVQGQWATGPGQAWTQYGPYTGESSHVVGPQPKEDPSIHGNGADADEGADQRDPNQGIGSIPGQGPNPYPVFGPGYLPYLFPAGNNGRPEASDPLFTSPADGPDLKLIQL